MLHLHRSVWANLAGTGTNWWRAHVERYRITEWAREADYSGAHLLGARLRPLDDSTLVRRRNRELLVTDGPFAEGREFILGFDILDVESEEEAIAFAERHPMSRFGRIEVRAAWPFEEEVA